MLQPRSEYLPFGKPSFSDMEIEAVTQVMRSGWIGMGPETLAFENELAAAVGAPHVITVNSCTSALFLSLLAAGVSPGDEVIVPSLTWCSTANAVLYLGATPVFCDVDPATFCATPASVAARVTGRTRAVIPVHFGGYAIDMPAMREPLGAGITLIEDAAHAFGAAYPNSRPVGSSGHETCFSFYANKNLSTGEGGAVALFDAERADRLRSLRQHGLPVNAWMRFTHASSIMIGPDLAELGYKANYTDLQAAIGRVQLRRQAEFAERRRLIAGRYLRLLGEKSLGLVPQAGLDRPGHARHLFCLRVTPDCRFGRDDLLRELRRLNIGATIHYALLHPMRLYRASPPASLPSVEALGREILTLPISADMTPADADYVCGALESILR